MQICAIDSSASLILAENAHKHHDYHCIECNQIVRLRRGIHRKAHFYHITPNRICKQHGKGMPHLMLQQFLKNKSNALSPPSTASPMWPGIQKN
jgi:competence protein CoiA